MFTEIPIDEATKPIRGGRVYKDYYWVTLNDCILFFTNGLVGKVAFAQCNPDKRVCEHLIGANSLYEHCECTVQFIPKVYFKSCENYVAIIEKLKT